MNNSISLRAGSLRCEIKPALGGCISGLWLDDMPVLRSTSVDLLHSVRQSASFPLVPFSNRVGQARLQWNGTDHPLVKNWAPDAHSIHGVGWERPWVVLDSSDNFALLSYEHKADPAWPFDFDTSQAFKLSETALEMSLSITNQSQVSAPVGLGWHPYFVKRGQGHIAFATQGRWEMGDDKLPTHRVDHAGLDVDTSLLRVDHCFDGWSGPVELRDDQLITRVSSSLRYLVVYTTPERDTIAIEPVSHVNNALGLLAAGHSSAKELGVTVLQPGETFSCEMRIEARRAVADGDLV